jgi:capsular exopolysaccharide synthesis family protein
MSKDIIYEAIRRSEQEPNRFETSPVPSPSVIPEVEIHRGAWRSPFLEHYEELKLNFLSRYGNGAVKTIAFSAINHRDGTSTTAINFAHALAKNGQWRVLYVDTNFRNPSLGKILDADLSVGLSDLLTSDTTVPMMLKYGSFHLLSAGSCPAEPLSLLQSQRFAQFLTTARMRFDYVVLDLPPLSERMEALVAMQRADGVILTVKTGDTRRRMLPWAKRQIEQANAKLIGVVLNRQKHYIPSWLYRIL